MPRSPMPTKETEATPTILASVCSCGNVMPKRVRDPETGRNSGEWCGHIGCSHKTTFYPQSVVDDLFECAIGQDDHDPRCSGECGPCGGQGDSPLGACPNCHGDGECHGCSIGFRLRVAELELAGLREATHA